MPSLAELFRLQGLNTFVLKLFVFVFFLILLSAQNGNKNSPKILIFYSNSLPLIFFLVFQGFDWRSGSVDPNPWSWMSGSIGKG